MEWQVTNYIWKYVGDMIFPILVFPREKLVLSHTHTHTHTSLNLYVHTVIQLFLKIVGFVILSSETS